MGPRALRPAHMPSHKGCTPTPNAETVPIPVIRTSRGIATSVRDRRGVQCSGLRMGPRNPAGTNGGPSGMPQLLSPDFDPTSLSHIEPVVKELLNRPVDGGLAFGAWVQDRSELGAALSEGRARLYIAMTCNTDDQDAAKAYASYVEQVSPRVTQLAFELDRRLVSLSEKVGHADPRLAVLIRNARADVEIFREQNIPLETELSQLSQRYDEISGAMMVSFDGSDRTLPQMARYQERTDRRLREAAWHVVAERRRRDHEAISAVYDRMIALRHQVALNAGFRDYVGYAFRSMHRFDYGPDACARFHEGVERAIVPIVRALHAERAAALGVDELRPWDLTVDIKGREPLRPFSDGADLVRRTRAVFRRLDPDLARMFESLGGGDGRVRRASDAGAVCLDLDSRKGKAPGGYQYMLDRSNKPFIFMNAAGMNRDVETMVHEAGHAFHSMLCDHEPLVEYRHSPTEFAEVASMSMELLTMNHLGGPDAFYASPEDHARARREQLERAIVILPWIATIDAFQHWVYANPGHTREQRAACWRALDARFGGGASWRGLEHHRDLSWQKQLHLFSHPFYYIEYGIAQLGALQLWLHSLEAGQASALERYKRALSLGGSRPLPDLFAAAGLRFDFGPEVLGTLAARVQAELKSLPA
ncbi:MAG: M3 family oligoendopeptidase [Leptolyngbya sp. PLA1]|nr:M3 family oligoendopeptidase [Leptolyngbya sp. PLA1]